MGGEDGQVDTNFTDPAQGAGTSASETLYIELRNGQGPIDPAAWFALDEEVQR
jgi:septal ring factor EnvC (AmiA/AmiB activator)